jgi:hypothetical protein
MDAKQSIIDLIDILLYGSTQQNDGDFVDGHEHDLFDSSDLDKLRELRSKLDK